MWKIKLGFETLQTMKDMLDKEVNHKFEQYKRLGDSLSYLKQVDNI
jgi:hypothetical protein